MLAWLYSSGATTFHGDMREAFFRDALKQLLDSTKEGEFEEFRKQAEKEQTGITRYIILLHQWSKKFHIILHTIHKYSCSIWPSDAPSEFIPLRSYGDGNCRIVPFHACVG